MGLTHTSDSKVLAVRICQDIPSSTSIVSIYYALESDIRVKSDDLLNFSRASVFNIDRLEILCAWIRHSSEKLWPFEFLESFGCSLSSVLIYHGPHTCTLVKSYVPLNLSRASVFNFECLDILFAWIGHSSRKLWPFELLESFGYSFSTVSIYPRPHSQELWPFEFTMTFRVQFQSCRHIMSLNRTSEWKVMTI